MKVGVVKETLAGERRVALVPDAVIKLIAAKLEVAIQAGAGSEGQVVGLYRRSDSTNG